MSEYADRKPKTIKIPGPDHPITIERNAHRIVVAVAGRVVADTRAALTLREASYPPVSIFHARTWTPRCSSGRPTPLTALKERVPAAQVTRPFRLDRASYCRAPRSGAQRGLQSMKGSDLLVAALENEGVEQIFAVPGEENLDVVANRCAAPESS